MIHALGTEINFIKRGKDTMGKIYIGKDLVYCATVPSNYQTVEYIESTGSQWIQLPIKITDYPTLEMRLSYTKSNGTYQCNGYHEGPQITQTPSGTWSNYTATNIVITNGQWYNTKLIIDETSAYLYVDDVLVSTTTRRNNNFDIMLFAAPQYSSGTATLFSNERVSYAKITTNETKIELWPCYRKSDGVAGMYDSIGKLFYTSVGTTPFLYG